MQRLSIKKVILLLTLMTMCLWWLWLADYELGLNLMKLGVYPGDLSSLPGIILAPLIHGSFGHLVSNTLPLILLSGAILLFYPSSSLRVFLGIWLLSGIGVWLWGRPSYHIGASGLTHGMMFYLFFSGIIRKDTLSTAIAMLSFFFYGSMVFSIFPQDPSVSFEYHFFGALAGSVLAYVYKKVEPKPEVKKYDWEEADEIDPIIGDQWKTFDLEPGNVEVSEATPASSRLNKSDNPWDNLK